ncbi:hypothetical protein ACHAPU_011460 [Fusarium lateritium]
MKLLYIGIVRNQNKPAVELTSQTDLSAYSRFTRTSYSELMTLFSRTVAERTRPGQRQDVEEHDLTSHALGSSEGICGIVDEFLTKYPRSSWADGEPVLAFPELKEYLSKYQDPHQADSILKIQKELDETKIVIHKTIESVLHRGEKLDDLVAKSDGLSAQSKLFYAAEEFVQLLGIPMYQSAITSLQQQIKRGILTANRISASIQKEADGKFAEIEAEREKLKRQEDEIKWYQNENLSNVQDSLEYDIFAVMA